MRKKSVMTGEIPLAEVMKSFLKKSKTEKQTTKLLLMHCNQIDGGVAMSYEQIANELRLDAQKVKREIELEIVRLKELFVKSVEVDYDLEYLFKYYKVFNKYYLTSDEEYELMFKISIGNGVNTDIPDNAWFSDYILSKRYNHNEHAIRLIKSNELIIKHISNRCNALSDSVLICLSKLVFEFISGVNRDLKKYKKKPVRWLLKNSKIDAHAFWFFTWQFTDKIRRADNFNESLPISMDVMVKKYAHEEDSRIWA